MSSPVLRNLRVLAVWLVVAPAALFANPWGTFEWAELTASLGPLALWVDRRIRLVPVIALGLAVIALLCVLEPPHPVIPRLLVAAPVFAVGAILVSRVMAHQRDLAARAAHPDGARSGPLAFDDFKAKLEREVGRARRHEKAVALLSIAANARSSGGHDASRRLEPSLRRGADDRALLDLAIRLARELRLYSDVVVAGGRVLALVPEVESESIEMFVKRVRSALEKVLDFEVQIGVGCFPFDAVCVDSLISAADLSRTNSGDQLAGDRGFAPEVGGPGQGPRKVPS